jgi:hypothetical protein
MCYENPLYLAEEAAALDQSGDRSFGEIQAEQIAR